MSHAVAMKNLRKQLRNVVKEELPAILKSELFQEISKDVGARLAQIDARSKDVSEFMLRNIALANQPKTSTPDSTSVEGIKYAEVPSTEEKKSD